MHMLANVQQTTIQPIIEATVARGALIHTDEYGIYARLPVWGYQHKSVCHGQGEYARDEGGDGFCEVHVNTIEGFWSLLRSWLRPHRGLSQEKLPFSRVTAWSTFVLAGLALATWIGGCFVIAKAFTGL